MTASFRFLDDIALADSAFEARGDTPSELCTAAARAVIDTMVDPSTVRPAATTRLTHRDDSLSAVLFDWLSDLVYLKDAERLAFHDAACTVSADPSGTLWTLDGTVSGEAIDPSRHELRADVKAITKHRYDVRQDAQGWTAMVVMDL